MDCFAGIFARAPRVPAIVLNVTGWQGNDGGQGGWQPQPFGPDPGTGRYDSDPYGQYQQPGYQTGGFPAQGYPPTSGFPVPGYPPPPPPKRSRLPMILSLVAIVIIIGAVVAIVLVNRKDSQAAAPQESSTTQPPPESTGAGPPSESEKSGPPTTGGGGTHEDWLTVDNTADSGLTYQVPPDWKKSSTPRQSGLDVDFTGNAEYGTYECGGGRYVRTFAASGDVQGKNGTNLDLSATMSDFAKSFATTYYGADAKVDLPAPADFDVEGSTAMALTAKVTQTVTDPKCQAKTGEVALVGVLLESDGQPNGVAMLVVVNDLDGGPEDPAALDTSVAQEILKTVSAG